MSGVHCEVPFSLVKLFRVWTVLAVFAPARAGSDWEFLPGSRSKPSSPQFNDIPSQEIFATAGQTLLLPCSVRNLQDKVVSWIRSKDLHILTSGQQTFSSDQRFEAVHTSSSGDFWGLRIRGARVGDSGQYECQVNTDPKMSLAIRLSVTVPGVPSDISNSKWVSQALIKGPPELYVQNGSPVALTCEISPLSLPSLQSSSHGLFPAAKPKLRWLHNNKEIFEPEDVVRISMEEKGQKLLSRLFLSSVSWEDAGQYTCTMPSTKSDTVKLVVVEGEHSEAMQRDYPLHSSSAHFTFHLTLILAYNYLLVFIWNN